MELVSESPIRLQLRLAPTAVSYDKAVDCVVSYLIERARRYQLRLSWDASDGLMATEAESVGLRIRCKRSPRGLYFSTSEHLMASTLVGRQDVNLFLTSDGGLDLQVDYSRPRDGQLPRIAVPDFLETLASDPTLGLAEASTGKRVEVSTVDFKALGNYLTSPLRNMAIVTIGRGAPILAAEITALVKRTCGFAYVVTVNNAEEAILAAAQLPPGWELPDDAIRVFSPKLRFDEEPLRGSRLFYASANDDTEFAESSFRSALNEIVWSAGRFTASALASHPMPSQEFAERYLIQVPDKPADDSRAKLRFDQVTIDVLPARIDELQHVISELRATVAVISEEKAFEEQVGHAWKSTAETQRRELALLNTANESAELFTKITPGWRGVLEALLLEASEASEQVALIANLRDTITILASQCRVLEGLGSRSVVKTTVVPPVPNDPSSLIIYLTERYPGRFALFGQGARSYKSTTAYADWDRFIAGLDVLGKEYYVWKTAAHDDVISSKEAFDERCRLLSFKSSPSATVQGRNVFQDEHLIRLLDGTRMPMYELRDHGTTMEERYMLYIGFVWDENNGQIVLGRFNHPPVLSMHT